jgi:outer membrane receptor protein involved in Fe transport
MNVRPSSRIVTVALVFLCLQAGSLFAGTTGKLAGRVLDVKKEPLPSANVVISGTTLGAVTDLDGYYTVINVPPGTYTVQVRLVGFRSFIAKNVEITVNNTTKLDLALEDEAITTADVVVTAQRPVVDVGSTSTVASISDNDIKGLPVQELSDIVNLQAGVVDGHFRGGRAGEVQYQVNGVSVNNLYDNTSTIRIDRSLIQEVQVITGTFDAEYGQAMSGVVNTVLISGGESFSVHGEAYAGSFVYPSGGIRGLDYKFRPTSTQSYQVNVSGPTGLPMTYFLLNGRRAIFDDYLYGTRVFTPMDRANFFQQVPGTETGDGKSVPLGYTREWSGIAKITNRSIPAIEINYQAIFDILDGRTLSNNDGYVAFRLEPDGRTIPHTKSIVHGIDITHTLSPSTFYTVSIRENYFNRHDWVYDNFYDTRYDSAGPPLAFNRLDWEGGNVQGVDPSRNQQITDTWVAKGSVTSQVTRAHQIKVGGEVQVTTLKFGAAGTLHYELVNGNTVLERHWDDQAFPGQQLYKPVSSAGFLQDMIEWNDLTVRVGVRLEYFNPRAKIPGDLANPADSIPGAPTPPPVNATKKYSVAPRLGVSYPITERSSIYFSYGHFYQLPNLGDMYVNANYSRLGYLQGGNADYTAMSNPDVKPERTVQYEFGYKQAVTDFLGLSVNLFYKDIRDLLGTQFINTYNGGQYSRLANVDFGNVTGFTISLDQRRIGLVSTTVDYTWQLAEGNSSDPQETARLAEAGYDANPRTVPFNWDQRHTLNATIQLSNPESYSVSAILRYASGQPYTPSIGLGITGQTETNSGRKPNGFLVDLRAEKYFHLAGWEMSVFARVFNLFDATYFNGFVFGSTGTPDYSTTPNTDRTTLADPTRFYAPRRVEVGITMNPNL